MRWSNIACLWRRELSDQLRDRRTLFLVAILPLFMYPLLGAGFLHLAQFLDQHPSRVAVVGLDHFSPENAPVDADSGAFVGLPADHGPAAMVRATPVAAGDSQADLNALREQVRRGAFDAAVVFSPQFARQEEAAPEPQIIYNSAREPSQLAAERLRGLLAVWKTQLVRSRMPADDDLAELFAPLAVVDQDVAAPGRSGAASWSRLLPFMVLLWALTGAFYPAIDLCAGEKERGTLETLLASPAGRGEIVFGKLLAVMTFSISAAVLNLAAFTLTGSFVMGRLSQLSPAGALPPLPIAALPWLLAALVPAAALFSALCLALAAFAKSAKEGQYYLMPLLMASLPLMFLPMSPGAELTLGTSLVPLAGLMLLLRGLIEGGFWSVAVYVPPVCLVTGVCCWAGIRWAIDQFRREDVLFRESERFHPWLQLRRALQERRDVPTPAIALLGVALILLAQFFLSFWLPVPGEGRLDLFFLSFFAIQVLAIAGPPLVLGLTLARNPRETFRLAWPPAAVIPLAMLLAVVAHPAATALQQIVLRLYPLADPAALEGLGALVTDPRSFWVVLIAFSLTPAVCEELAFRGFLLRGLERPGRRGWAIVGSAIAFGAAHSVLQQSIVAAGLGILLGYLAVTTRSILPTIAFHATHNALMLLAARFALEAAWLRPFLAPTAGDGVLQYSPGVVAASVLAAGLILGWIARCAGAAAAPRAILATDSTIAANPAS